MNRRRPPISSAPPLTVPAILAWADAHYARTGELPTAYRGSIPDAPLGTNWRQVDNALRYGLRGLPGGSSVARLLAEHRGHRNIMDLPRLTVDLILTWADAWHRRTGRWPLIESGPIPEAPADTWRSVYTALWHGGRGLPPGGTLPKLLAEHRGARNLLSTPPLTIEEILAWADRHKGETGEWPGVASGPVIGQPDETWNAVNAALDRGARGLPGGDSLAMVLHAHRGARHRRRPPRLTANQIRAWAIEHGQRTGRDPLPESGAITAAPGETWKAVHVALAQGLRGLPGGWTLARLLAEGELPEAIGRVRFTDGIEREVHEGDDGRQFVVDCAGVRVFGVWLLDTIACQMEPSGAAPFQPTNPQGGDDAEA
jgi:hypothetical protein